jgi:hypothetical protein
MVKVVIFNVCIRRSKKATLYGFFVFQNMDIGGNVEIKTSCGLLLLTNQGAGNALFYLGTTYIQ